MPVLPLVGSMISPPGTRLPSFSAASIIASPMRSLTLLMGFRDSILATTSPGPGDSRCRRTRGVDPITSVMLSYMVSLIDRPPPAAKARRAGQEKKPAPGEPDVLPRSASIYDKICKDLSNPSRPGLSGQGAPQTVELVPVPQGHQHVPVVEHGFGTRVEHHFPRTLLDGDDHHVITGTDPRVLERHPVE